MKIHNINDVCGRVFSALFCSVRKLCIQHSNRANAQRYIKHVHWKSTYIYIYTSFIQYSILFDALVNLNEM